MKRCKFLLLLTMLFIGLGSFAQTTVEFVAGTDKGSNSSYWLGSAGKDEVTKDDVTMKCDNATFAAAKYSVRNYIVNKTLTFTAQKNITSIEFVDGEKLGNLSATGFSANDAKWTGKSTEVSFTVSGEAKYSKAIVTIQSKDATTISFAQTPTMGYVEFDDSYNCTATLKSGDNELSGLAVTYESSDPAVAEVKVVNGVATVTPLAAGTAVITAKFAGNDAYDASEAQFTFKAVDGMNIFHETFDNMDGEGGNDGNFSYTGSLVGNLGSNIGKCDNEGWTTPPVNVNGKADKCVRIEMSSSITTPALTGLSGDAFLMFSAAQNRTVGTSINLSISGGGELSQKSVSLEKEFDDYMVLIKNATPETKITFSCSTGGCFYLDDVQVKRAIALDDATDNEAVIEKNSFLADDATVCVSLNRALSSERWNTISLPFAVAADELDNMFGEGTKVKALDRWDDAESTLYFKDVDAIEAGVPYLIKPGIDINSFMLEDMTIDNGKSSVGSNGVYFTGTFSPVKLLDSDVFLGTDGMLYTPDPETEGADVMKGFRAYFSNLDAASAKVNIDGNVTSIDAINGGAQAVAGGKVYTIDGRYVGTSAGKLAKGLYIVGGKKIVVK